MQGSTLLCIAHSPVNSLHILITLNTFIPLNTFITLNSCSSLNTLKPSLMPPGLTS